MAIIRTDDSHYKAIAAKIREKTGLETTYKPSEMASGIEEVYNAGLGGSGDPLSGIIDNTIVNLYSNAHINGLRAHGFINCTKLETVDLPNLTGAINGYAFSGCTALTSINFPKADSYIGTQAFNNTKIKTAVFPMITYCNGTPFINCTVEVVDFGRCSGIYSQIIQNCSALKALIIRSTGVCTLSQSNAFANTNIESGTAYIYVPASLVDSYKAATNWSNYVNQIRAIEDYTVDGTVTGELDESKI